MFTNVLSVLAPHSAIYCWHAHKRQALISTVWSDLGILDHQQIIWVKPSAVFGRVFWHFRHEPCMMGWVQGTMPPHDDDHSFNSVWEIDWEGKARIVGNEHPTQKPVEIFARPMRKHTKPGDICFEPFSGSGSQLIAAETLGGAAVRWSWSRCSWMLPSAGGSRRPGSDAVLEDERGVLAERQGRAGGRAGDAMIRIGPRRQPPLPPRDPRRVAGGGGSPRGGGAVDRAVPACPPRPRAADPARGERQCRTCGSAAGNGRHPARGLPSES